MTVGENILDREGKRPLENELFKAVALEIRPSLAQIIGWIYIIKTLCGETSQELVGRDLGKIENAVWEFFRLYQTYIDDLQKATLDTRKLRHDLRTPMNHIIGYAELLIEEDQIKDYVKEDLQRICDSASRVIAIVDESLNLTHGTSVPQADSGSAKHNAESSLSYEHSTTSTDNLTTQAARIESNVLIVDDNQNNRELIARHLSNQGHKVTSVAGGSIALDQMAEKEFDLVILDLMMPDLDGHEVLTRMKGNPMLRHIPVIMVSALNELDSVVQCIEGGADDYLTKPLNPILLLARVNACAERKKFRDQEHKYLEWIEEERLKSENLILNILPAKIADRLKRSPTLIADRVPLATVLFADIIGFTPASAKLSAEHLVRSLNMLFTCYDRLSDKHGIEKIKTIGDAYFAVAGLPVPRLDHAEAIIDLALEMMEETEKLKPRLAAPFDIRIGIHSGPVVAGVIGKRKFTYDLWGDTVNVASRNSSIGSKPCIRISASTHTLVKDLYSFSSPEVCELKGKGDMTTYLVTGRKN